MSRRKVLIVPAWYPSPRDPMWGIFVRDHARAIALESDVAVLHVEWAWPRPPRPLELRSADEDGLRTVRLRVLRGPGPALLPPELAALAVGLRHLRREGFRPDVIHAHGFRAGLHAVALGRAPRLPVVVSEHSSAFPRRLLHRWERLAAAQALGRAEVVAPVSAALRQAIEDYGISARFRVVPNPVDDRLFQGPDGHAPGGPPRLLMVGGLVAIKNVPRVLHAVARLAEQGRPVHLDVAGDGPEREHSEALARRLGLSGSVTFHGALPRTEVARLMREVDLLVLASDYETLSCTVLEAQMSGLPVVATAVGGVPEALGEGAGTLVAPNDDDALLRGIGDLLDRREGFDGATIARSARARFGLAAIGARWSEVYAEAETLAAR